jgi:hypothetical protein
VIGRFSGEWLLLLGMNGVDAYPRRHILTLLVLVY